MSGGAVVECRPSKTDGTYEIPSLPAGGYTVRFTKSGYVTQYFDGKATAAEADLVSVQASVTTGEVDAAMVKAVIPTNVTPPEVSGVGKVGDPLSCTEGTWTGTPASYTYRYSWYRGGTAISGAHSSTYTLATDDAGASIKCGVAATNSAGTSSTAQSNGSIAVAAIRTVSILKEGNGSGTVTSSPAGIDCGLACAATFDEGTSVTLTAVPDPGSEFTGWSGGDCSGTGTCTLTLRADANVIADFAKKPAPPATEGSTALTPPASTSAPPPAPPANPAKPKPLQCKKRFHNVTKKGKTRCEKVKKKTKGGKGRGSAKRG
jgi:hypothetical protein